MKRAPFITAISTTRITLQPINNAVTIRDNTSCQHLESLSSQLLAKAELIVADSTSGANVSCTPHVTIHMT